MTSDAMKIAGIAAAVALGVMAAPALAAQTVSQETPSADACSKTVNALGAVMGHKAETAPDGRPMYRFTLRTNGLDYDVLCDAKSGVVGDVTPRATH